MRNCTAMFVLLFGFAAMAQETSSHPACMLLDPGNDAKPFTPPLSPSTCSTGGWYGLHGVVTRKGDPVFDFNGKFFPVSIVDAGELDSCNSHLTAVDRGTIDPIAGFCIPAKAVRIGNRAVTSRADMLAKRFVVEQTRSMIHFSYAVVFQDPDHAEHQQPSFEVVVLDQNGHVIPNVVNLGNGRDKLIAEKTDGFFSVLPDDLTIFRPWSCATIDLSGHLRETVTVQFITEDCALGAHFVYAYIGDFCSENDCGPAFTLEHADECGPGRICVRATPAQPNDPAPQVELRILQDGAVRQTLRNPTKSCADTYCFAIDPEVSFDWVAVGTFGTLQLQIGSAPEGVTPGVNNDYLASCTGCCPGAVNLIANGDFEAGATAFTSDLVASSAPKPGEYAVVNAAEARAIAATWIATSHTTCSNDGRFLAINGETKGNGSRRVVWSQRAAVIPGADYRFCLHVRNLPQCAFDVVPKLELRFGDATASPATTAAAECGWTLVSQTIHIPSDVTAITSEILLLDDTPGDGNDLALDDISLQKLAAAPSETTDLVASAIVDGAYTVSAVPERYAEWQICEVDGDCFRMSNPALFTFDVLRKYRVTRTTADACAVSRTDAWELQTANGVGISLQRVSPP